MVFGKILERLLYRKCSNSKRPPNRSRCLAKKYYFDVQERFMTHENGTYYYDEEGIQVYLKTEM